MGRRNEYDVYGGTVPRSSEGEDRKWYVDRRRFLDGSGSSQMRCGDVKLCGDGRTVHSVVAIR